MRIFRYGSLIGALLAVVAFSFAYHRAVDAESRAVVLSDSLNTARTGFADAIAGQRLAEEAAAGFEVAANVATARSDSAARAARALSAALNTDRAAFASDAAAAPDTCRKVVASANKALATSDSLRQTLASGLSDARGAIESLKAANDTLRAGSSVLAAKAAKLDTVTRVALAARKPSLLSRIRPHVGFGVAAGVDATGAPRTVAGAILGWAF